MTSDQPDLRAEAEKVGEARYPRLRHDPVIYGYAGAAAGFAFTHAFVAIGAFTGAVIASRIAFEPLIMVALGFASGYGWAWDRGRRRENLIEFTVWRLREARQAELNRRAAVERRLDRHFSRNARS